MDPVYIYLPKHHRHQGEQWRILRFKSFKQSSTYTPQASNTPTKKVCEWYPSNIMQMWIEYAKKREEKKINMKKTEREKTNKQLKSGILSLNRPYLYQYAFIYIEIELFNPDMSYLIRKSSYWQREEWRNRRESDFTVTEHEKMVHGHIQTFITLQPVSRPTHIMPILNPWIARNLPSPNIAWRSASIFSTHGFNLYQLVCEKVVSQSCVTDSRPCRKYKFNSTEGRFSQINDDWNRE